METLWVRPQWALPVALATLVAAVGSLVSVFVPVVGVVAGVVAAVSLGPEAVGRSGPLRLLQPLRATQHVLSPPASRDGLTLLICSRYDAPRRGLVLGDRWRGLGARLRSVRGWLALGCAVVAGCAAARMAGVEGAWLGAAQLAPTVALIVAVAAAADVALSDWAPGAGDSAAGAAVALALHDELVREPPAGLSPALLLVGAGASGPQSLRAQLRAERLDARDVALLEIGPCGGGAPAWATRHPQLRRAAERAAAELGVPAARRRPSPPSLGRLPALRLCCLDARGVAPRAHQPDDTPERVDVDAALAALDLALGIVDALDAELAERRHALSA